MNDQLTALKALEQAVAAGTDVMPHHTACYKREEEDHLIDGTTWNDGASYGAVRGSLSGAEKIHALALPGWDIQIGTYDDGLFEASVSDPLKVETYDEVAATMARAWLLAIIRALIAQLEGE